MSGRHGRTVRYYEAADGSQMRIVEHRRTRKESTGPGRFDYDVVMDRRWLTLQQYKDGSWVKVRELGDYVEPKDAP